MRIVQLISSAGLYGAEKMMLTLAQSLARMGHQCSVVAFVNSRRPNTDTAAAARALDLPAELVACNGRIDRRAIAQIRSVMEGADILHCHGYKADVYGYFAARHGSVKTVSTCHNWIHQGFATTVYNAVDRLVLPRFDAVAAVSAAVAATLNRSGVPHKKVAVIANGIDVAQFSSAEPTLRSELHLGADVAVLGYVGRLSAEKGVRHLLRAVARVIESRPEVRIVLAGDGPERAGLEALTRELRIAERVTFLGERSDIAAVYASCDVVVLPSLTEGLPMTALEALASARPMVATAVGDVPQVIIPEETGLLVPPGDSAQLAAAITRLVANPAQRRQLGERGRCLVMREHSAEAMAGRYAALYRHVLGEAA